MKQKEGKWKDPQRPTRGHQAYQHLQEGRRGGKKERGRKTFEDLLAKSFSNFLKKY